jgi:hypothetical protein
MAKYMFAYHGGKAPETPQEGAELMALWGAWFAASGASLVTAGNPIGKSVTLSADGLADGGGSNPLSGYSIAEAESLEAAVEIAKSCPHLSAGTIEIAALVNM